MISRVAESCFWLYRYIERMDSTARMVDVNFTFTLDSQLEGREAWLPLLLVTGEAPRFTEQHPDGIEDGELVQRYLTWDRENPVSILSSAYWARESARTIRESISREMWECLNRTWLWLDQGAGPRFYERDRSGFFERIKEAAQLFRGVTADTMLHEEPYDFMRLGMQIERAGMTARILDVKHEMLAVAGEQLRETPRDFAQWHAILRTCSGIEPFLKRGAAFKPSAIVAFLMGDEAFPRAIRHCLQESQRMLGRIRDHGVEKGREVPGGSCAQELERLVAHISAAKGSRGDSALLHATLTEIIDALAEVADDLHRCFFAPSMPDEPAARTMSEQSQSS